jgi:hypothetical protein
MMKKLLTIIATAALVAIMPISSATALCKPGPNGLQCSPSSPPDYIFSCGGVLVHVWKNPTGWELYIVDPEKQHLNSKWTSLITGTDPALFLDGKACDDSVAKDLLIRRKVK